MASWVFSALWLLTTAWPSQAPATLDRVVAVVNGDLITLSDVRAVRTLRLITDADEAAIVTVLIDRRLVLTELRRFQAPEPEATAVAARVDAWRRSVGGDAASVLNEAGVADWFIERWMMADLQREQYLAQRFAALNPERRADAVAQWMESLRSRATIVRRSQRF